MPKNILIISSDYTGHGHKSITNSLLEQFSSYPDIKVHVVDGFVLGGNFSLRIGKLYGTVTRNAKEIWRLVWDISLRKPNLICEFTEFAVRESFLALLTQVKPDLILSVHPNFNGSIINILEDYNLKIPFVTLIADLVSITPLWADPRVDYIICPTLESKYKCLEFGVSESKLKVIGFPIRSRFCSHISESVKDNSYSLDRPLECLIMSGGEGSGNMSRVASILLNNYNCNVKIVAGRNKVLKKRLENSVLMQKFRDRLQVFGFMENIQELMLSSDIAFTRGSPNTMLEAVCCNVPLVITGNLPGQEEGNPGYLLKHNLGIVCKDIRSLKNMIAELLADNAKRLNEIKKAQRDFRDPNVAKKIVDFILGLEYSDTASIPDKLEKARDRKFPVDFLETTLSEISESMDANFTNILKKTKSLRTKIKPPRIMIKRKEEDK